MFLIDKKTSVDKPLNLRSVSEHDNVLLQFTSAMLITNYNNVSLQMTIAWLLQFSKNCYYNLRRLLLQFTADITIHDRTNFTLAVDHSTVVSEKLTNPSTKCPLA